MALLKRKSHKAPVLARFDFESFRQQAIVFATLNLFLLAALLLLHSLFSSLLGPPSPTLLVTLGLAFLLKMLELLWLWAGVKNPSQILADVLVWASIVLNIALALVLTLLTNRGESPYFVLLALPVLQAAYRFRLATCILVILAADFMTFFWVWYFGELHAPVRVLEYLESGVLSVVFALMGVLVWLLVNQLREDQSHLSHSLDELERTREKLLAEEKLAMAGRLSSAIAHEIRNPVAIINSSLITAERPELAEQGRFEMYSIARSEAARLEKLTSDFLTYARPGEPRRTLVCVEELLNYVVDIARVPAAKRNISIVVEGEDRSTAYIDGEQLQRALLNLLLNAIDAASLNGRVTLRVCREARGNLELQVEDSGEPIPHESLPQIFEPFFTTKPNGTGLGLAISKNIARAQGGDLRVTGNERGRVCFTLTIATPDLAQAGAKSHG